MIIRLRAIGGAVALLMLVPVAAAAQRRNPYADLFGRTPERTGSEFTTLQFRTQAGLQIGKTFDQTVASSEGTIPEGIAGGADAALTLDHAGDRLKTQAHGRYAYQEYRREPALGVPAYDAGAQMTYKMTTRLAFDASAGYTRSPFVHTVRLDPWAFGDQVVFPVDRYASLLMQNDTIESSGGITSQYSKHSRVSAWGLWRQTKFVDSPENNFELRGFRTQWQRELSRNFAVHAGYGRDEALQRQSDTERYVNETIDIGVDYSKALSLARRTSLGFETQTALLRENGGKRRFRVNGGADLQHGFLQTWRAQVGFHRGTEFVPGYAAPLLSDTAQVAVSGYLASRLIFYANADAGQSSIGFDAPGLVRMYSGASRVTIAATRRIGFFTQYYYYHYQMPPQSAPSLMLPMISRQTLSFGIEAFVPLIDKDKVPRDTR